MRAPRDLENRLIAYHNVLIMEVEDPLALLEAIERETDNNPALYDAISRVAPAMRCFEFHSAEEFEARARSIVLEWLPRLHERSFLRPGASPWIQAQLAHARCGAASR